MNWLTKSSIIEYIKVLPIYLNFIIILIFFF